MADDSSLPPPPPPFAPPPPPLAAPTPPPERDHAGRLVFLLQLLVVGAVLAGVAAVWPKDDGPDPVRTDGTATTLMTPEVAATFDPSSSPGGGGATPEATVPKPTVDLFAVGPAAAVQDVLAAADHPTQLIQLTIYGDYLFVAYRDPHATDHIDRRMWRDGEVGDADANPIDDRVDADTTPQLFGVGDVDLARLPAMIADAPSHYGVPVTITHVIVDRFLPFDQRVLVRVYATPADGRSGGGYVSYATDGTFVKACC